MILSSVATVIASQALISGAFSLTRQAMQLGYFPRVTIRHTSSETEGQIYIPEINWFLAVACIALVIGFREVGPARRGVRHRGHRHDGDHLGRLLRRDAPDLGLVALRRRCPLLALFLAFDIPFFAIEPVQVRRRRLRADPDRRRLRAS